MASKKTAAAETPTVRLKKDGTPRAPHTYTPKRPDAELLAEYKEKRAKFAESSAKTLASFDKKILKYSGSVGSIDAAKELLGGGMSPAQIDALIAKLQQGKKALAGKTPEEIEALRLEAVAGKLGTTNEQTEGEGAGEPEPPAVAPPLPPFLAPVG